MEEASCVYRALTRKDGKYWKVEIKDLPEKHFGVTQGRNWHEAKTMAIDAVATLLDIPHDSFKVVLEAADPEIATAILQVENTRREAEEASRKALDTLTKCARLLTLTHKIPVRDVGPMLGISYQYAGRLATSTNEENQET